MASMRPIRTSLQSRRLKVGHLDTLVKTVAHEMVHLKRFLDQDPEWTQHDERFLELGNQISAVMGFDPKEF
jgi:predicted SprT family Zn-dependent metalloprotease